VARKINWHKVIRQGGSILVAADMNTLSRRWHPRSKNQLDVIFREEVFVEYGLEMGHDDRPTHHCARTIEEGESIIDQTLDSGLILLWTMMD